MDRSRRTNLMLTAHKNYFHSIPHHWVRAPGRVDLMGSHTDYNLGHVMTMPLDLDVWICGAPLNEPTLRLYSLNLDSLAEIDLTNIEAQAMPAWMRYPAGVAKMLADKGYETPGFEGVIHSTVPIGSGLSSSAAFESATAVMFQALADWEVDPLTMAQLCQRAENQFVGMGCGILDQYSSLLGEAGKTILLDCKQLTHTAVPFPDALRAVICNTNASRELTGSEYGERRAQCEEGARILQDHIPGVTALGDVTPRQFEQYEEKMPKAVAMRSRFIIEENARVQALAGALEQGDFPRIGALYAESFQGACTLFEICIPAMHSMMEAMTAAPGLIGARQAGAGFGGCMVALVSSDNTKAFAESVRGAYKEKTGIDAQTYVVTAAEGAQLMQEPSS